MINEMLYKLFSIDFGELLIKIIIAFIIIFALGLSLLFAFFVSCHWNNNHNIKDQLKSLIERGRYKIKNREGK